MKIVVLMGSPRKRHGAMALARIEEKFRSYEESTFEYVYLKKAVIEDCRGCDSCLTRGDQFCPIKDELKDIREKMDAADGIIFACPVYAHQVTAPMKRLIDRLSFYFHRPVLFGKSAIIVATTASTGLKAVVGYLTLTCVGWGLDLVGRIGINSSRYFSDGSGYEPRYTRSIDKSMDAAVRRAVATRNSGPVRSPGLYSLASFLVMREKARNLSADASYWKRHGWFASRYYYEVRLGLLKTIAYLILEKLYIPLLFKSARPRGRMRIE